MRCGCFSGYLDEFRQQVEETHGENRHAKDYISMVNLAESHFNKWREC